MSVSIFLSSFDCLLQKQFVDLWIFKLPSLWPRPLTRIIYQLGILLSTLNEVLRQISISKLAVPHKSEHAKHAQGWDTVLHVLVQKLELALLMDFEPSDMFFFTFMCCVIWGSLSTEWLQWNAPFVLGSVSSRATSMEMMCAGLSAMYPTSTRFGKCTSSFKMFVSRMWEIWFRAPALKVLATRTIV